MSYETLRLVVEAQFNANWTATAADKVDHGGNHEFTPPQAAPWVRLVTNTTFNENAEVGITFQRVTGIITVQCFVPLNTGEKNLNLLVDDALAVFQNKNFGGVKCYATTPVRIGESGNWYQVNAKTDFQYDVFS